MRCPHYDTLKAQLAEAKDEIAAWTAYADDERESEADVEIVAVWQTVFKTEGPGPAMALRALVQRAGRCVTHDALLNATRIRGRNCPAEDVSRNLMAVYVCKLRKVLKRLYEAGRLPDAFADRDAGIITHWGIGYEVSVENAASLLGLVSRGRA